MQENINLIQVMYKATCCHVPSPSNATLKLFVIAQIIK